MTKARIFLGIAALELLWLLVAFGYSEAQMSPSSSLPYVEILEDGHAYAGVYLLLIVTTPVFLIAGVVLSLLQRRRARAPDSAA